MGTYSVSTRSSYSSRSRRRGRSRDLEAARTSDLNNNLRAYNGARGPSPVAQMQNEPEKDPSKPIPVTEVPIGYSRLAAFMDLEDDLAIFRRFSRLHLRLLLYRQADIEELEEEIINLDKFEAEEARLNAKPESALNRSWRREKDLEERRVELVKQLRKHMKAYDDELFRFKQKLALKTATKGHIANLKNWMKRQTPRPLVPSEAQILLDAEDICALQASSEDSAVLTDALRRWARDSCGCLAFLFRKKGNPASEGDPSIKYYDRKWEDALTRIAYATLVSVILIAGVIVLFYIDSPTGRLACLCVSTFLCGVVMALFTTAKKGEIMGATAAYCAVMVVFVGSTLGDKGNGGAGSMAGS
ncbi:hypothetical protein TWF694_000381 [Orbilia ellipsospora]|uniref:DUF6594 domain-containing protein n=1 Tax=Orbilia ellipsospora TaxID=2528407 RepID=A0AAV9XNE4_9PEZI